VRVVFHPRAVEDVMRIEMWWTANRPAARDLFQRELETTLTAVAGSPMLGAISTADDEFPDVHRILMRRTRYYVYYRVIGDVLEVLAIWHTARGGGPTFG
jgi:plasmid stabilization system protein ParE